MNKITMMCLSACAVLAINANLAFGMDDEDKRPAEHRCPITLEVMKDPVVAADGHSYEKAALLQHFKANGATSPITRASLTHKDLFENHALKVMIQEWRVGNQTTPSKFETRDAGSIAQRIKEEFKKNADLLTEAKGAKNKHIVAFLGNTGAGKSTLVNLLAGKKLKTSSDGEDYILDDAKDSTAMIIGQGGGSETLYPKSIDVGDLRFFDLPGFNDTDGSERNLVNAAFIRQILLDAASVRFVFVVGQDQFTSDRSASVKQMFTSIKNLFVTDLGVNLTDNSVFVATKVTCDPTADMVNFLLKKTDSKDKAELNQQLQSWNQGQKLCRMFHPLREQHNSNVRTDILEHIKRAKPVKIRGVNVSALYPLDTKNALERVFLNVMEETFKRTGTAPLITLSDYDRTIAHYNDPRFWQTFEANLCAQEQEMGLLKEFCITPYTKALSNIEKGSEKKRQNHIQTLRKKRQERVEDIGKRTETRARAVIASLVPPQQGDEFVPFDFAYHREYYDQVCGPTSLTQLATDATEQEIVRQQYAGFISRHSHEQMMKWQQKFSGVEDLKKQLEVTKQRLSVLEEPFIKARKAEEEKQQQQQQQVQREEEQRRQRIIALELERKEAEERRLKIPDIARGHEAIYERFLKGVLIYRPNEGSDVGKIELPIAALANPLNGTFDLSRCGDTGKYLSISTGYRKGQKAENRNKLEVWFAPWFFIDKEKSTMPSNHHLRAITKNWDAAKAPVGIFWTWGSWNDAVHMQHCDCLVTDSVDGLASENLYEKWRTLDARGRGKRASRGPSEARNGDKSFHISFLN